MIALIKIERFLDWSRRMKGFKSEDGGRARRRIC